MSLLKLESLSISYPRFYVKNFSLCLNKNEIVVLAGKNGSGKTTILESIVGVREKS